jgi:hypothetical protein
VQFANVEGSVTPAALNGRESALKHTAQALLPFASGHILVAPKPLQLTEA